jgi:peptidyl-prolyl cis-trans isomerase C
MNHRSLRAVMVAAAVLTAAAVPAWAADAKDPVVAVVNGKEIHRSTVVESYQTSQFRQVPLEMVYDQVLDFVVTGQLLLDQAHKAKLEDDPKVKEAFKAAENRILQQAFLAKRVDAEITEDAIKKRYEDVKKTSTGKEEVHARHILVESEDAAKAVIADLKSGTKFEDEAKLKTKDPSGKENGGDLGFFAKEDMVPEFAEAAFKMKPGEVSQTPIKTQFGWHVIKVEERRVAPPPTYDEAKASIKGELSQQAVQKVIEGLSKTAEVKRFDINGNVPTAKPDAAPAQK